MPIHDWTRVDAGLFHAFRFGWVGKLCDALNTGVLPEEYYALLEEREANARQVETESADTIAEAEIYARRTSRIAVRHKHGRVVAVIDIVSPGNKGSKAEIRTFVEKAVAFIDNGVHLMVIDLFPPGPRDPLGLHKLIWDEYETAPYDLPAGQPPTCAAYDAGDERTAYVNNMAFGEAVPDMPLFLRPGRYVTAPLAASYEATWAVFPKALKPLLGA